MKRAVILFAEGYETVEALLVVDLLRRGGVEVTMASITEDEFVRSSHGVNVEMDAVLGEVDVLDYDAIIHSKNCLSDCIAFTQINGSRHSSRKNDGVIIKYIHFS